MRMAWEFRTCPPTRTSSKQRSRCTAVPWKPLGTTTSSSMSPRRDLGGEMWSGSTRRGLIRSAPTSPRIPSHDRKTVSALGKHFKRSTVKVSYSSMPNMAQIISGHKKKVTGTSTHMETKGCNCRSQPCTLLEGKYKTTTYTNTFKDRSTRHKASFTHRNLQACQQSVHPQPFAVVQQEGEDLPPLPDGGDDPTGNSPPPSSTRSTANFLRPLLRIPHREYFLTV